MPATLTAPARRPRVKTPTARPPGELPEWATDGQLLRVVGKLARRRPLPRFEHDDLVQDVAAYVVANLGKFDPSRSRWTTWVGWQFRSRRSHLLSAMRRQSRDDRGRRRLNADWQADPAPGPTAGVIHDDEVATVLRAVERLDPDDREAIVLRFGLDGGKPCDFLSLAPEIPSRVRRTREDGYLEGVARYEVAMERLRNLLDVTV